ncbi:hypothetical protein [Halorussus litoreus]|uniref:hypothetical protein n=1 Tax=Halorussus litoreus TaxID=1710536 RepID=UPI000E27077D|nr:hypothetical protein [Halorussus litoreus]
MDRERRAVLRTVAAAAGVAVGSGTGVAAESGTRVTAESRTGGAAEARAGVGTGTERRGLGQQVDAELQPGVTLFDLDGDGEYVMTVERAGEVMRDDDHPRPIHVTSGGQSTVDYAVSTVEAPSGTTLGGLDSLSYDYYAGGEAETGESTTGAAPGETFLVVENDDGRHGASLAVDRGEGGKAGGGGGRGEDSEDGGGGGRGEDSENGGGGGGDEDGEAGGSGQWRTFDVLARMGREGDGTGGGETVDDGTGGRWFEYTAVEDGYDGESFEDPVERFGADARLVRVGVGVGDPVTPVAVDAYFDNLAVDGEPRRFPASVVNRVS